MKEKHTLSQSFLNGVVLAFNASMSMLTCSGVSIGGCDYMFRSTFSSCCLPVKEKEKYPEFCLESETLQIFGKAANECPANGRGGLKFGQSDVAALWKWQI